MSVVPDRGNPTTNTGSSLSNPKPRTRWKKSGVQTAIIRVTSRLVLSRVVLLAALAPLGQLQGVAPSEVLGGLGILAPRVQDLGQAEVQQQSLRVRQLRFLQQPALCGQILLRKFAAQEFRQFVMREGEAGIVPQRGAEGVFRALKIADLLQSAPRLPCASAKSGFSSSARR